MCVCSMLTHMNTTTHKERENEARNKNSITKQHLMLIKNFQVSGEGRGEGSRIIYSNVQKNLVSEKL